MNRIVMVTFNFRTLLRGAIGFACLYLIGGASADALKPYPYNVDPGQISVSGISSGGYMAQQFETAFSKDIMGAGIVAGGPYFCAAGKIQNLNLCMRTYGSTVQQSIDATTQAFRDGKIDDPANIKGHAIYMFSGEKDNTVVTAVMDALKSYYKTLGVADTEIKYVKALPAAHAQIIDRYDSSCNLAPNRWCNACDTAQSPYINDCRDQFNAKGRGAEADSAGQMLAHFYGAVDSSHPGEKRLVGDRTIATSQSIPFFQKEFFPSGETEDTIGMDKNAFIYVPQNCANGNQRCKLHVAFHGCSQNVGDIDTTYVLHAGYNEWAENNNIVVLYPQTKTVPTKNVTGCWDWWGYTDSDSSKPTYHTKIGKQMMVVKAMIDHVAGLMGAPAALRVQRSGNKANVTWLALTSKDLAGYNVYRSTSKPIVIDSNNRVASNIKDAVFADTGLKTNIKEYYYTVTAVDKAGKETGHGPDVASDGEPGCVLSAYPVRINDPQACKTLCRLGFAVCGG